MIIVISDEIDQTTNEVIEWLISKNKPFIRLNPKTFFESINIELGVVNLKLKLKINNQNDFIDLDTVNAFWFRKGDLNFDYFSYIPSLTKSLSKDVMEHLYSEWITLRDFILNNLSRKNKVIGNYFEKITNKLDYLCLAKRCGLLIPDTYVCNTKSEIKSIVNNDNFITKSIQDIFNSIVIDSNIYTYTSKITKKDVNNLSDNFFPSLVQEQLKKRYELRIFFLNDKIYTMAIFSQLNKNTEIDFRNYDSKKPNRCVPYKLPLKIEKEVTSFIKYSELNTGSIDMVVTNKNKYYFLEVNPTGQFGILSHSCNYNIEREIAKYLSNE